jgi:ribosomal protein L11 methylase PrmA
MSRRRFEAAGPSSPRSTTSARAVVPGGALVLSGITAEERDAVHRVLEGRFRMDWSAEEEGWCCALVRTRM